MLRSRDVSTLISENVKTVHFESEWEGNWQRLPPRVVDALSDVDVVVKFGMNLLRDAEQVPCQYGVVGYHHGDPRKYRGRPAGFYEMLHGESVVGIIVQRLSNSLDAGKILAEAYSRVIPSSYATTLNEAYCAGIQLLAKALTEVSYDADSGLKSTGTAYSLPKNVIVIRSMARMLTARLSRLVYGSFKEKRWKIGWSSHQSSFLGEQVLTVGDLAIPQIPTGHTFAADPVGVRDGWVYCEIMDARTGKGTIARFSDTRWEMVGIPVAGNHLSYPQIIFHDGGTYLFPEMASIGPPTLFLMDDDGRTCTPFGVLQGLEGERLLDATLFFYLGTWYLFGGRDKTAASQLHLWTSDELLGPWFEHPKSPIRIDPRGARMAGPIVQKAGELYRLGQDCSRGYGRSITSFLIHKLSPSSYFETRIGQVTMDKALGPHSLTLDGTGMWLDLYTETWTPLAGIRRVMSRIPIRR